MTPREAAKAAYRIRQNPDENLDYKLAGFQAGWNAAMRKVRASLAPLYTREPEQDRPAWEQELLTDPRV